MFVTTFGARTNNRFKYKRCLGRGEVVFLVRGTPLHEGRDFVGLVEHRYFGGRCVKTL